MTISLNELANIYGVKCKTLYPYEYFKNVKNYNNKLNILSMTDIRSSLTNKLPPQS